MLIYRYGTQKNSATRLHYFYEAFLSSQLATFPDDRKLPALLPPGNSFQVLWVLHYRFMQVFVSLERKKESDFRPTLKNEKQSSFLG